MSQDPTIVLEVRSLSYAYGSRRALDEVDLIARTGHCTLLLGPNGAGKSTLFSLITHLYDSRSGQIRINGFDLRKASRQALAQLGVVFQQPTLDLDLSVRQNLRYHAALHGLGSQLAHRRIHEELERLDMLERIDEKVRQLNGGHRRRVEIARALLHRPRLLLLDEPTVGLDVPSRKSIVRHVHQLARSGDMAVFWATHLIDEIDEEDEIVVLHRGRVQATGNVNRLLEKTDTVMIGDAFDRLTQTPEISR